MKHIHFGAGLPLAVALCIALGACAQATPIPTQPAMTKPPLPTTTPAPTFGVPAARLAKLAKGVNIAHWFWYPPSSSEGHFAGYITDEDIQLLSDLGVLHVRLVINPEFLLDTQNSGVPKAAMLAHVDKAIDRLLAAKIAVIVDMHDEAKKKWEQDDAYVNAFEVFWGALAKHMSRRDPDMVFLELLNEPVFDGIESKWLQIQERMLKTMRANAPQHTLIATGPNWSHMFGLAKVTPTADKNIIYTFHFYDPFVFTHQGATWSSEDVKGLMQVPYPVVEEKCKGLLTVIYSDVSKASLQKYCADKWDAQRIDETIARAADWSKRNSVPVYAGEFGVHCPVTPPMDRQQWLHDTTMAFNKYGIGWASWTYDECFGLDRTISGGKVSYDKDSARALGFSVK